MMDEPTWAHGRCGPNTDVLTKITEGNLNVTKDVQRVMAIYVKTLLPRAHAGMKFTRNKGSRKKVQEK